MQSYKIEKENTKSDIKVPQNEMDMCPSNYIQEVDALEDISPQRSEQKVNMAICATLNQPNMELSTPIKQLEVNLKESDLYMNEQLSLSTDRQEFTSQGKSRNSIIVETMEVIDEDLIVEHQPKTKEPDGNVGFSNILKQAFQKVVKKGFEFTLMVVGESGLGKSTLINSMFLTDIYNPTVLRPSLERIKKTTTVETTSVILKEDGVTLLLTVVDTPGFGDAVDNSKSWEPIIQYIDKTYEDFSNSEVQPIRKQARDERVHCCLYFIQPSGHGLKSLDIESMKRLCDKVNVVPVIAKADTLTSDECASFKKQILHDIAENEIKIYNFPKLPEENDNLSLKEKIPFAVVGSNTVLDIDGKKVRGRKYPWGIAEVENLEHCDFIALRTMIIRTHLEDLKDVTNNFYYENYRLTKLGNSGPNGRAIRKNKNQAGSEEERREQEFKKKLEEEVLQKEQQLRNSEAEINRRLKFARQQIEEKAKELEEKRKRFEIEKEKWEKESQDTLEELSRKTLEVSREPSSGKEKMKKKKKCFFKK